MVAENRCVRSHMLYGPRTQFSPRRSGALINLESKSMAVHLDVEESNGTTLASVASVKKVNQLISGRRIKASRGLDISRLASSDNYA